MPHSIIIDGKSCFMDQEAYPMNGRDSYASVITELKGRESTCTQYGDGFFKCAWCNKYIKVITYREHELDISDGWIETEPTCTESGVAYFNCNLCREEVPTAMDALGHNGEGSLVRVSDTEFDFFYECERGCGVTVAGRVSLKTETNPDGEVESVGTDYYVCYDEIYYFVPAENVQ